MGMYSSPSLVFGLGGDCASSLMEGVSDPIFASSVESFVFLFELKLKNVLNELVRLDADVFGLDDGFEGSLNNIDCLLDARLDMSGLFVVGLVSAVRGRSVWDRGSAGGRRFACEFSNWLSLLTDADRVDCPGLGTVGIGLFRDGSSDTGEPSNVF